MSSTESEPIAKKTSSGLKKLFWIFLALIVFGQLSKHFLPAQTPESTAQPSGAPLKSIADKRATAPSVVAQRVPDTKQSSQSVQLMDKIDHLANHPNPMCQNGIEGPYGTRAYFAEMIRAKSSGDQYAVSQFWQPIRERLIQAQQMGCFD